MRSSDVEYEIDGNIVTFFRYDKWEFATDMVYLTKKQLEKVLSEMEEK